MHDLIVRNGLVVDGSGAEPYLADIGVVDGVITEIGNNLDPGSEEIDAGGCIVTPGFVDVHTHYDGQVIWDDKIFASSAHGVTTVIMGNCGVGFAPCRASDHQQLYGLMEGVEDIPEIVMAEGLTWDWETFPEYLDALDRRPHDIDIGAQLPHCPLRVYVMGQRGSAREPATSIDLERFTQLTYEAMSAGALGFSTSRFMFHRTGTGALVPSYDAGLAEMDAIAEGIKKAGKGIFQAIIDYDQFDTEFALLKHLGREYARPVTYSLIQPWYAPDVWQKALDWTTQANAEGIDLTAQIIGRPTGLLYGLELSFNPFACHPSYRAIADLPLAERVAIMRKPEFRAQLLSEDPIDDPRYPLQSLAGEFANMYRLGDPPNYEPPGDTSIAAIARRLNVSGYEAAYDILLEDEGKAILFQPAANFVEGNLEVVSKMMAHENTILGLGDGGAHYGLISDASYPTFMLTYWARDRKSGRMTVADIVRKLAREPAEAYGLLDRGRIGPGYKADLNVIDMNRLRLRGPAVHWDLPGGGKRLMQAAEGFVATIVSGQVINREGKSTGALPGRLIRGAKDAPASQTSQKMREKVRLH